EAGQEAAMKYFLLSVLSSAVLLFGFSYLYGLTGTTNIAGSLHELLAARVAELDTGDTDRFSVLRNVSGPALVALIMIVAGLGFRITAVPFHFYAPDVYQGTSISAAALLAYIPKIAGFAALVRVLGFVLPEGVGGAGEVVSVGTLLSRQVPILLWFVAALT